MNTRLRRPSPSMVVAVLALVVALGGTATAASGLITGRQIARSTITGKNVKNRSLTAADLAVGTIKAGRTGAAGRAGAVGPAGPVGPGGAAGAPGAKGDPGTPGVEGDPGATGATGPAGVPGATGPRGATGPSGSGPVVVAYRVSAHFAAPPLTSAQAADPYPVTTKTPRNITAGASCDPGTYPVGGGVLPSTSRVGAISVSGLIPVVNPDPTQPSGYVAAVDNHTDQEQGFQVYVNCIAADADVEQPTSNLPAALRERYTAVLKESK